MSIGPVLQKKLVIIYGPTGVGKSDFAEKLAQQIPAEIINMDVGQMYTSLSIGTAKPAWKSSPIKHHLFDILDNPINYSVTDYRDLVLKTVSAVESRGNTAILVGGSGFYLKSLLFPVSAPAYERSTFSATTQDLWQELYAIDAKRAQAINPHDRVRIERALAIWQSAGKQPSSYQPIYAPPANYILLFLTRERQELYQRINDRVLQMMNEGFVDEVKSLIGSDWQPFLQQKKLIGYNEIISFLMGAQTKDELEETIKDIQQRTRHYAKRQHTFWRMLERQLLEASLTNEHQKPTIEMLNLTFLNIDLYIKQLSKQLISAR